MATKELKVGADGKAQWNRRFAPETIQLIEALAEDDGRSDTSLVEALVRQAAEVKGISVKRARAPKAAA